MKQSVKFSLKWKLFFCTKCFHGQNCHHKGHPHIAISTLHYIEFRAKKGILLVQQNPLRTYPQTVTYSHHTGMPWNETGRNWRHFVCENFTHYWRVLSRHSMAGCYSVLQELLHHTWACGSPRKLSVRRPSICRSMWSLWQSTLASYSLTPRPWYIWGTQDNNPFLTEEHRAGAAESVEETLVGRVVIRHYGTRCPPSSLQTARWHCCTALFWWRPHNGRLTWSFLVLLCRWPVHRRRLPRRRRPLT